MRFAMMLGVIGVAAATMASGCAGQKSATSGATAKAPGYEMPEAAKPAKELLPLTFMVGRWVCVNPNGSVNDEHWMTPRGNHMAALFKQASRKGTPGLVEVSLVTVEADGSVKLALRHLHSKLEVPENQKELSLFTLKSTAANQAEFAGSGVGEGMTVTYRLDGSDKLVVDVNFPAGSKEKSYSMTYYRES